MNINVKSGDVLDEEVDVLISTANPWLNMSGGVNGAILLRGGHGVQDELRQVLRNMCRSAVESGSVVRTGPGPLRVKHILHAVAIDPFYGSSVDLVQRTIEGAFREALRLGASSIAMPALATGYGPLSIEEFARALVGALERDWTPIVRLVVVLRRREDAQFVASMLLS